MWHKEPCSSRDYGRVRESGPRKTDEDGDVDEDDHHGDDSPVALRQHKERVRESPPCASSSMAVGDDVPLRLPPPWPPVMMAPSGRVPKRA